MAGNPPSSGAQPFRPLPVGLMAPQTFAPPYAMQFRPAMFTQQGQPYIPPSSASQQFHPLGAGQNLPPQFSQLMQQFPPRPNQPGNAPSSSQPYQMPYIQQNVPVTSGTQQQNSLSGAGIPFSSSYTFQAAQMDAPSGPVGGQPWLHSGSQSASVTSLQQTNQQSSTAVTASSAFNWQEYESADGRRYYYNKVTKQSSWEKPLELMTPIERADASTVWKEFTTPEGKKYYFNKETKQSTWTIPEELKLARERAEKEAAQGTHSEAYATSNSSISTIGIPVQPPSAAVPSVSSTTSSTVSGVPSSPVAVTPVGAVNNPPVVVSGSSATPAVHPIETSVFSVSPLGDTATPSPAATPLANANSTPANGTGNSLSHVSSSLVGASVEDIEDSKKGMAAAGNLNVTPLEDKAADDETLIYASKQEAKNAFKSLLESVNVESDWTWEQAMRVIINDKRYGALRTLGERKQAFNEYLMQRKKVEAEERRLRQRKAKEEFIKMLEDSKELTSSTRWSKAVTMFEDDERFKAVEREADREDLFRNYLVDLQKKEKEKAQEEYRRNRLEFRQFLETCGFVKVDTQWRKVQDHLEDDERCTRLEKIDRLEVFQEYIHDLEKEEEEQRKRQKEQLRRAERKNRDAFRQMMEEHVNSGIFTAKTTWLEYCQKVKESVPYQAVASNSSGSTPKDLFEDAIEELEKQYHDDKTHVKDSLKSEKINVASTWTFEDFKTASKDAIASRSISDINLLLVYEDLIERAKEKEEKETKKRQRLAKDFTDKLSDIKEITASSIWEESKQLVEDSSEYRAIGEESSCKDIFGEYVARLQEKAKDRERRREEEKAKKEKEREEKEKKKDKEKKDKEKERDRERERERERGKERPRKDEVDSDSLEATDYHGHKDDKRRDKDRERKHRKRHHGSNDSISSDKDEKEDSKRSRRHGSDRKKSRKHGHSPDSDIESRHKKHKRDTRDGYRHHEELEDGELGEDGEIN